jgi:hypothetical protein
MRLKGAKVYGPEFIDQNHCQAMLERIGFRNQSIDHQANQSMKKMREAFEQIEKLEKLVEDERVELASMRHKWEENFEEYSRWKLAKESIYKGAPYRATA